MPRAGVCLPTDSEGWKRLLFLETLKGLGSWLESFRFQINDLVFPCGRKRNADHDVLHGSAEDWIELVADEYSVGRIVGRISSSSHCENMCKRS